MTSEALGAISPDVIQSVREAIEKSVETVPGLGLLATKAGKWLFDKTKLTYFKQTRESLKELYEN